MTSQTQQFPVPEAFLPTGLREGLEFAILPREEKPVGHVILAPDSSALIHGVRIEPQRLDPADRGFFTELTRLGATGLTEKMLPAVTGGLVRTTPWYRDHGPGLESDRSQTCRDDCDRHYLHWALLWAGIRNTW
jgi:hypothetical protein